MRPGLAPTLPATVLQKSLVLSRRAKQFSNGKHVKNAGQF
jgi:hypothetical protein